MPENRPTATRKRLRPKTYSIGLYVVGIFILLEMVALLFIFWIRQEVKIETTGPSLAAGNEPAAFLQLDESGALKEVPLPNLPMPEIEARLDLDLKATPEEDIAKLNEDARAFRRDGNFPMAEAALEQALKIDPENVLTLTNVAMLEEAKGDSRSSLEAWKEVIRAGRNGDEQAGSTVELARQRARVIEQRYRIEGRHAPPAASSPGGPLLRIDSVETDPSSPGEDPERFTKRFSIRKLEEQTGFSVNQVKIQLFFYEQTSDNRLVPADISARFLGDSARWDNEQKTEILEATYEKEAGSTGTYYGYLLRIFYLGQLQDEKAEPAHLLTLFEES